MIIDPMQDTPRDGASNQQVPNDTGMVSQEDSTRHGPGSAGAKFGRLMPLQILVGVVAGTVAGASAMSLFGERSDSFLKALGGANLIFLLPCLLMFGMMFMMMGKKGE